MTPELVVEIVPVRSGALPEGLIVRCYAASRKEQIVLVLNGVRAQAVNIVLDPIVRTMPLDIPGVLYVDIGSIGLADILRTARLVFASTPNLRAAAEASGIARSRILPVGSAFLPGVEITVQEHAGTGTVVSNATSIPHGVIHKPGRSRLSAARRPAQDANSSARIGQ